MRFWQSHCFRLLLALPASLLVLVATPAAAQDVSPPQPYSLTDTRGVSLTGGSLSVQTASISIGQPAQGGLAYSASYDTSANAWRHSTYGGIYRRTAIPTYQPYQWYQVTVMGSTVDFRDDGTGVLELVEGSGTGTLVYNSGPDTYTYTALDGSVATFQKGLTSYAPYRANQGLLTQIVKPNGEVTVYTYTNDGSTNRIQSITNNLGYQIHFDYASNTPGSNWSRVTTVTAFNMATDACAPSASTCSFSRTWPSLTFSDTGTELHVTDALGRTLRLIKTSGAITGVARPVTTSGQNLTIAYSGGKVATVSDGVGTWNYSYTTTAIPGATAWDTTTTVTDPLSHTTTYKFAWIDPWADPEQPEKLVTLRRITDTRSQITEVIQDAVGLLSVVYPEGNAVVYPRTDRGDPMGVARRAKGSGTYVNLRTVQYADCTTAILCGRPTSFTDALGHVTDLTYDAAGNLLTVTRPAPSVSTPDRPQIRYSYAQQTAWYRNSSGVISPAGSAVWRQTGSSECATGPGTVGSTPAPCIGTATEVVSATSYEAGSASHASNLMPMLVASGAGDGSLTAQITTEYDPNGDAIYVDGPLPGSTDRTRTIYDAMRQIVGVINPDPDGSGSRSYPANKTQYNADGQVEQVWTGTTLGQSDSDWAAFAPLQTSTVLYNSRGLKIRDLAGVGSVLPSETDYDYDTVGRLTCSTVRMNPATFGTLTAACAPTTISSNGPDRISRNNYDDLDRIVSHDDAVGTANQRQTLAQDYTANSKVAWVEDAAGNRSAYNYDGYDRIVRLNYPSATTSHVANVADHEDYEYDAQDNPTAKIVRMNGGSFVTTFDALNRPTVIDAPSGTTDRAFVYDNLDRQISIYQPGGGLSVTRTYDAMDHVITETGPLGTMTSTYDVGGRRTRLSWPDGFYVNYEWNVDGQMKAITQGSGASAITAYGYDNLGQRVLLTRGDGVTTTWTWDSASRLTSMVHDPSGTADDLTQGWTWSPAGQALSRTSSNSAYSFSPTSGSTAFTNNGLNQSTAVGGASLTWSGQGNLVVNGGRTFAYDASNVMTGVSGSATSTLTWDPLDRLYRMTGTGAGYFLYDGSRVAGVYSTVGGTIAERWVGGPADDEWAILYTGATTATPTWFMQDRSQSVLATLSSSGAVSTRLKYDEFGRPDSGNTGRFQFQGQMMMPDYGLQSFKARMYDAALGRFLQTDPVAYDQGLNLYAFEHNDPLNLLDPTGTIIQLHGSKENQEKFVAYVEKVTGLEVSVDANGVLTAQVKQGESLSESGAAVMDAISLSGAVTFNLVSSAPTLIGDDHANNLYDNADFDAFYQANPRLGNAIFTHVVRERAYLVGRNLDPTIDANYVAAHNEALKYDAKAFGATSVIQTQWGLGTNPTTGVQTYEATTRFNFTYTHAGAPSESFMFRLEPNGQLVPTQ